MMERHLIETAAALGLYVLLAGMFAIAFTIAKLNQNRAWLIAAIAFYAMHALFCSGVIAFSPLDVGWKALLVASSLAVLAIPAVTWRFLQHTHSEGIRA